MLFNSYIFIFGFVPIVLLGFFLLGHIAPRRAAIGWLALASLFFYAWWNPVYLPLLLFSIGFNYLTGLALSKPSGGKRGVLACGIAVNLGLLGYFKYTNFFIDQVSTLLASPFDVAPIFLPLAISFFTFQQIAYLCDAYQGHTREYHFIDYCLFVSYFPQLIAGPIVHHKEMMPQFMATRARFNPDDFAQGLSYFVLGLFKKVVVADNLARFATPVFTAAGTGGDPTLIEAWGGVLAYTGQIYFDFSGYSDMAVGLGWMIGIKLPVNFHSPYKAADIADFWRRWHITLSRFLRDYLYIPLGGNRKGGRRRLINLMLTMLLGGLWHGAGWTFIIWGGLHGAYLVIHQAWRKLNLRLPRSIGVSVTFLAVVVAWVFFRAESMPTAVALLKGMVGLNGISLSDNLANVFGFLSSWGVAFNDTGSFDTDGLRWLIPALLAIFIFPNTQEFMRRPDWPAAQGLAARFPQWRASTWTALLFAVLTLLSLLRLREVSEFLYFQF